MRRAGRHFRQAGRVADRIGTGGVPNGALSAGGAPPELLRTDYMNLGGSGLRVSTLVSGTLTFAGTRGFEAVGSTPVPGTAA